MDEKDVLQQEFDLDALINEVKNMSDEPGSAAIEEILTEEESHGENSAEAETTPEEVPAEEIVEEAAPEDTKEVAEEAVQSAPDEVLQETAPTEETPGETPQTLSSDTVRIEKIPESKAVVHNAAHIDDEDTAQITPPLQENAEPFSDNWEPEYEQPIAEYVPASPIAFRPKSRLREIKKKLVAGPEKQYYLLSEIGVGKLQAAIFFSFLVVVLSAATAVMHAMGSIPENRMRLLVFSQFFAMLLSAGFGCYQLLEGAVDLFKKRFSLNTLLLFTFLFCCADGVLCLKELRVPCCAAFSLQMTMSLWCTCQNRNTRLGQLDTMRKATHLDGLCTVTDPQTNEKIILHRQGEVEHFTDTDSDSPKGQKFLSVYAIVVLLISIGAGVLAGILHGYRAGVQVAAVTPLAATPASMFIIFSRPLALLERRLHRLGTVICGWQGVWGLSGKAVFPVDHADLFPTGSVKMNGVKFFGSKQPDQIIAYAAALIRQDGGTLDPLFNQLLESRNGIHYTPTEFRRYEGGIGAQINNEPVLAGTLRFLKTMGVEIPEGIRVSQAVCVAVDGELCGLFAVTYERNRAAATGLSTLCGYRKLKPVLLSKDFMLSTDFIRSSFGVNPKKLRFPDEETRQQLQSKKPDEDAPALALITKEGLSAFAYAVTGARSLKTAVKLGLVIHMIGGILGILMMLVLAYLGETRLLIPANLFLYELIWMVPGLLVTEWTRSI